MKTKRAGFTMIELIFVIVVIGILFSIALPKLVATRDDAALAADVANMAQCIKDAGAIYTAKEIDIASGDPEASACDKVKCFNITYATNGSNFIVTTNLGPPDYCSKVGELGGHLAHTYVFKGTSVSY